jgi:hypothetical protein
MGAKNVLGFDQLADLMTIVLKLMQHTQHSPAGISIMVHKGFAIRL